MEQSVDSNLSKKFKAIASLPIPYFAHISDFILKKGFLQKPSKPGHGNLVLITSAVQLHYNIRSFKGLCQQIIFFTLNGFFSLSKPPSPSPPRPLPFFLMGNIKMDRILTKIFYIVFQVLKELLIKICKMQSLDLSFLVVLY